MWVFHLGYEHLNFLTNRVRQEIQIYGAWMKTHTIHTNTGSLLVHTATCCGLESSFFQDLTAELWPLAQPPDNHLQRAYSKFHIPTSWARRWLQGSEGFKHAPDEQRKVLPLASKSFDSQIQNLCRWFWVHGPGTWERSCTHHRGCASRRWKARAPTWWPSFEAYLTVSQLSQISSPLDKASGRTHPHFCLPHLKIPLGTCSTHQALNAALC